MRSGYIILMILLGLVLVSALAAFANELTRKSSPEWGTTQPCTTAIQEIAETVNEALGVR